MFRRLTLCRFDGPDSDWLLLPAGLAGPRSRDGFTPTNAYSNARPLSYSPRAYY